MKYKYFLSDRNRSRVENISFLGDFEFFLSVNDNG